MKKNKYIFLFFLLLLSQTIFSQKVVTLNRSSQYISGNNLSFWENSAKEKINFDDFNSVASKFKPLEMVQPNFGFSPNDFWFRFKIKNTNRKELEYLLKLNNPNLDIVELFKVKNNQIIFLNKSGDLQNFNSRPVRNRIIAFPLKFDIKQETEYLLKVNNGTEHLNFNLELTNEKAFQSEVYQQQYFFGIFFGILLFILIFNIVVGVFVKEKISLYYCLYISSFFVLQLSNLGFGKEYLWPNNPYISNHINPITATLSIIFLLKFCKYYLNTSQLSPKTHKTFIIIERLLFFNLIAALLPFPWSYTFSIVFINAITLLLNILIIAVSIYAIYKKYKPAKLFFSAFAILFISVFAFILKNFGILPSNTFTDYGLQFGSIFESILLTLGIIYRLKVLLDNSYQQVMELNLLKEEANIRLETQVQIRTKEIEDKNKEIISSISYAKRIQETILPNVDFINSVLNNWELFYAPKDIVAGDFYWVKTKQFQNENWILFAVADCTGHGVPGAMMSVMCSTALNTSLLEIESPSTSELLEKTSEIISKNLSTSNVNDGMDISVCAYNPISKMMYWSGANNPLIIIRNGQLQEITATKKPIGPSISKEPFAQHAFQLMNNDLLYLFSDGIVDQFGGEFNKKFKKSQLKDVLNSNSTNSIQVQIEAIKSSFYNWKNKEEQIDDICVLIVQI